MRAVKLSIVASQLRGSDFFRRLQRRFHHMLRHLRAEGEGVEPGRIVVGVERNQPVEAQRADLPLEQLHLRLARAEPEFAVQIAPAARMPRAVLEAGRIAKRVDVDLVAARELGILRQLLQETDRRENPRRLIAMNAGENPDAIVIAAAARADEKILLQRSNRPAPTAQLPSVVGSQALCAFCSGARTSRKFFRPGLSLAEWVVMRGRVSRNREEGSKPVHSMIL